MSKLWEVDPETKAKLQGIQKKNGNNICVDCGAPSPQWASPKFGIFVCLNCSGTHRGLGVHISFIRSVTMDGFKVGEVKRMALAGNDPWRRFYDAHPDNEIEGRTFESATVKERYDCKVGDEWKEVLGCKVEGREFDKAAWEKERQEELERRKASSRAQSQSRTPGGVSPAGGRGQSPANLAASGLLGRGGGGAAASTSAGGSSQKAQNEAYFAKMGAANANRAEDVPPSQGGKFSGFGSEPAPTSGSRGDDDWLNEVQKDPLAGITKGFGWLGKNVRTGYEGFVKPNVQKLAESDLAAQARQTTAQLSGTVQQNFNRFVEGPDSHNSNNHSAPLSGTRQSTSSIQPDDDRKEFWEAFGDDNAPTSTIRKDKVAPEKKDFWDSFGAPPQGPPAEKRGFWDEFGGAGGVSRVSGKSAGSSSIGSRAMKSGGGGGGGKTSTGDGWGDW